MCLIQVASGKCTSVVYACLATDLPRRETYTTATFKNSAVLQVKILDLFVAEMEGVLNAAGILPALVMQPITKAVISHMSKNGGNALGIEEADGPLICEISPSAVILPRHET